ncbi:MAG: HIT domain-containing protein [Chthonomonadales bacterium]|nr:HIT domain-containing protein [Chthonomonadales bacterium]
MERLWAPWRLAYVENADTVEECIFCAFPRESDDEQRFILCRGERAFVILNAFPYSNGHLMVAPYRHTASLDDLDASDALDLMGLVRASVSALKHAYRPDGFNIGINMGRVAGAGIDSHIHVHVVPRWNGDTNFMAVVGDTRVLPASLADTYERLKPHFDGAC